MILFGFRRHGVKWFGAMPTERRLIEIAPATHPIDSSNTSRHDMIVSESPPEGIVNHGTVQFESQESQAQPNGLERPVASGGVSVVAVAHHVF